MSDIQQDIVERLRGGVFGLDRIPLCEEAAAEIERLRSELERAREFLDFVRAIQKAGATEGAKP